MGRMGANITETLARSGVGNLKMMSEITRWPEIWY